MRVIAGTFRSRPLSAPRGLATRPTSDRLRETLFNVLGGQVEGSVFADLFAGSGAVGIEALSRGAAHAYFAESDPAAITVIRRNLRSLGIEDGYTLISRPIPAGLHAPEAGSRAWDIAFLDPPYKEAAAYTAVLTALGSRGRMARGGLVIAEHRRERIRGPVAETGSTPGLLDQYGALHRYRVLEQGDAALSFYRFSPSDTAE